MYLGKVKNYIIIILVAANIISAALLVWKYYTTYTINRQAEEELITLLNEKGIAVTSLPKETEKAYVLERNTGAERAAAEAAIGSCEVQDMGGGIYVYQGLGGTAQFRSGGRFEISLENGSLYSDMEMEKGCKRLLSDMGFIDYTNEYRKEALDGGGKRLVFGQSNNKSPIFNAQAAFEFSSGGQLKSVSGLWMFASPKLAGAAPCKSAGAILLTLADTVELKIDSIQLGFRLKIAAPGLSSLTPEWRALCGDGTAYYLDAFNGDIITQEE